MVAVSAPPLWRVQLEKPNRNGDQTLNVRNKAIINEMVAKFRNLSPVEIDDYLAQYWHEDAEYFGFHPINVVKGRDMIGEQYYKPYCTSFPDARKHLHFLFGGSYLGKDWVVTGGNMVGTFMNEWLEIPPTRQASWIRFAEFYELVDGRIAQSRMIFDLMSLLRQSGYKFFNAIGPEIVIPGPATRDGIILGESDPVESLFNIRVNEAANCWGMSKLQRHKKTIIPNEETLEILRDYWHEDMIWYGMDCIGSAKGLYQFQFVMELQWQMTMSGISGGNQFAHFAEGKYVCGGGYPSIYAQHTGDAIFGIPATGKKVTVRDFGIFRCEDGYLAENWCYLDLADLFYQLGIDVLKFVRERRHYQVV